MKIQEYILNNNNSFNPIHIFECGQCFRWNKQKDGSYTGVVKNAVVNVKEQEDKIKINAMLDVDINEFCEDYFDLKTDYNKIKETLSKIDKHLKKSIEYGNGIRILHQDLWETLISFIISANNNIPRIKKTIEKLAQKFGNKIIYQGVEYYTFPTPDELSNASVEELRKLGLGFRDKRVWETTQMVVNNKMLLKELEQENDIEVLREKLKEFPGVGDKVADCIMLFSLKKLEVFPVDVWVRRVMNELYIKEDDETKVNKKQLQILARTKVQKFSRDCSTIFVLLET